MFHVHMMACHLSFKLTPGMFDNNHHYPTMHKALTEVHIWKNEDDFFAVLSLKFWMGRIRYRFVIDILYYHQSSNETHAIACEDTGVPPTCLMYLISHVFKTWNQQIMKRRTLTVKFEVFVEELDNNLYDLIVYDIAF